MLNYPERKQLVGLVSNDPKEMIFGARRAMPKRFMENFNCVFSRSFTVQLLS
jgi:hypothetical protein